MVNHGPSKGCNTCKQRHVKCDEGKPSCQRCLRRRLACGGYERKAAPVKFKVVKSADFARKHPKPGQRAGDDGAVIVREHPPCVSHLAPSEQDAALCFFLGHVATMGRDLESTRGFFEIMTPVLAAEDNGSAMSLAVAAVSMGFFNFWRKISWGTAPWRIRGQALQRLQVAIEDSAECKNDATIWAALILQLYDNLIAVNSLKKAPHIHHDGAVALLKHRGASIRDSVYGRYLLCYILHTVVSSAIREKRSLLASSLSWLDYDAVPWNHSSVLDMIGISVANLQYSFPQLLSESPADAWAEIKSIDTRLLAWLRTVPTRWLPSRLQRLGDHIPSVTTYSGACDIYPSVKIASIWNVWRCYRLIILKISLALRQAQQAEPARRDAHDAHLAAATDDDDNDAVKDDPSPEESVQKIVDAICASAPFFLGNRSGHSTLSELTDASISLPGYHNLDPTELPELIKDGGFMARDEHVRHVIVQGPWHIMSPLSHILDLCSRPHGHLLANCLRPGQIEWIRGQLVRVGTILRLNPSRAPGVEASGSTGSRGPNRVDFLAEQMRDGLRMTSGT